MRPYFERDGITIYHGDCRDVLPSISAGSVQLAITSPPYFATREYGTDPREIGREGNPAAYVHNLVAITDMLAARVHQRGNLFVNLGDKTNADGPVKSVQTEAGYPSASSATVARDVAQEPDASATAVRHRLCGRSRVGSAC
jgi:hypothetical protein